MDRKPIELEEGWSKMERGVTKLKRLLEGEDEPSFDADLYMQLYTTIYNMCTQKPPHDYSEALYNRYRDVFCYYINESVLPSLRDQRDEKLLRELHRRWDNHNVMTRWLSRFFNYLDRYYISRHSLASLKDVGLQCFKDQVYTEIKRRAKDALLMLIEKEREGEQVDRALVKNVLDIYIRVGMDSMDAYEADFEADLLSTTATFYKRKAAVWIAEDSCPEYMVKAEECLRAEEDRVQHYLHISTKPKLLEQVETEVLAHYEQQLLEKENSGCAALLRDDKKEDLARMYRLFSRIPKEDLVRVLHSLACAKYKVLTKSPEGKGIDEGDMFRFNAGFTDKMRRIKIMLPALADEKKRVVEDVAKDRQHAIDAAIVRTMKSRKVMNHQQLTIEVVEQLRKMFQPDPRMIKKQVESLIDREYLERDTERPNTFKYVA